MNINRRVFLQGASGLALAGSGLEVRAQGNWPTKPIRVISGGSAGGSSDIFMRLLENRLREKLGQSIVIENMPGAGGTIAAGAAARATDLHTFFISNLASNGISVSLYKNYPFDTKTELPAVARFCILTNGLVVRREAGINTAAELLSLLKSDPSKGTYGSAGAGTSSHLTSVMLGKRLGVELNHIPYKGTAANLTGVLRGDVLFSIDNLPVFTSNVQGGVLKLLAVSTATRSPIFPDVPTLQESGLADFDVFSWFGLSAATATPRPIIERVSAEIVAALKEPEIIARFREVGGEAAPMSSLQYGEFIQAEIAKWEPVVKSSGATVQ